MTGSVLRRVRSPQQRFKRSQRDCSIQLDKDMARLDTDSSVRVYLREIAQTDLLSPSEEVELAARIRAGDRKAREHMIKANLRLVVKIARDYSGLGVPLVDLISEGNIGLMTAVDRFDPRKGAKFSTYGSWWIKQSIKRALANQSKVIRLPTHIVEKISKMRRIALLLSEELGRDPTDDELGEELGIPLRKLALLKRAAQRMTSLDEPVNGDEGVDYSEIIGDEDAVHPLQALADRHLHHQLGDLLETLDEREHLVIGARYGLNGSKPATLEEVGRELGVTRERIRQLQCRALEKMRRALVRKENPVPARLEERAVALC